MQQITLQDYNNLNQYLMILRGIHPDMTLFCTHGACLHVAKLLLVTFPQGDIYYNSDHVLFKFGKKYYDITGEVEPDGHIPLKKYGEDIEADMMRTGYVPK